MAIPIHNQQDNSALKMLETGDCQLEVVHVQRLRNATTARIIIEIEPRVLFVQ